MSIIREQKLTNYYISASGYEGSMSASISGYGDQATSTIFNQFGKDIIFSTEWSDLSKHIYFANAYIKTKHIVNDLIANYPIGASGSTTSNLFKEHIDKALVYIKSLDGYQEWCLKQLCGATLVNEASIMASATAVPVSLSGSLPSKFDVVQLPALIRDADNYLIFPQGLGSDITRSNFDLYQKHIFYGDYPSVALSYYDNILQTALAFDFGRQTVKNDMGGTGEVMYAYTTYDGVIESKVLPSTSTQTVNRNEQLCNLIEKVSFEDDDDNNLDKLLNVFGGVYDELKLYIDNFTKLFRNYWGNYSNIPKGNIQKLVAFQLGVELFDSSNNSLIDSYVYRNITPKETTWNFWNRILCSLPILFKSKGTLESLRAAARSYGLADNVIDIANLTDNIYSNYYKIIQTKSTAVAIFGNNPNKTQFQAILTNLSANPVGYSPLSTDPFSITFRLKFTDDVSRIGLTGNLAGSIFYNSNSSIQISYDTKIDNTNERYISYIFKHGSNTLSSNFGFFKQTKLNNPDGWNTLCFSKTGTLLSIRTGYIVPSLTWENPTTTSITGSTTNASVSSMAYIIGSTAGINAVGNIQLQEFQLHKGYMSDDLFQRKVRNYENIESPSAIIFAYKLRENAPLTGANNYLIDSGPNNLSGTPTIYGLTGGNYVPYAYRFNLTKENIARTAGFSVRASDDMGSIDQGRCASDIRIGISIAWPFNADLINYAGDLSISDLVADPTYAYGSTDFIPGEKSTALGLKHNEIISRYENIGQVTSLLLETIDKVHGHLASYYSFIDQLLPVSRDIIEKGVIIEDITTNRQVIERHTIKYDNELENVQIDSNTQTVGGFMDGPNVAVVQNIAQSAQKIEEMTFIDSSLSYNGLNLSPTEANTTVEFVPGYDFLPLSDSIALSFDATSVTLQRDFHNLRRIFDLQSINYSDNFSNIYEKLPARSVSSCLMNLSFDDRKIFLSTSTSIANSLRSLTGTIYFVDSFTGKFFPTEYDAIEVSFINCVNAQGLNRVRMILNGVDIPYNENIFRANIPHKNGTKFVITTIGSVSEGLTNDAEYTIRFRNLLNESDALVDLNFYISDTIEAQTQRQGYILSDKIR